MYFGLDTCMFCRTRDILALGRQDSDVDQHMRCIVSAVKQRWLRSGCSAAQTTRRSSAACQTRAACCWSRSHPQVHWPALMLPQQVHHCVWAGSQPSQAGPSRGCCCESTLLSMRGSASCTAGLARCAFWGYCMGHGGLALGHALLEASRLPIVFDLDETLLVAYSLHTLDVRLAKLRAAR
jgi:hypothetical protein